jgi:hypothetical protein
MIVEGGFDDLWLIFFIFYFLWFLRKFYKELAIFLLNTHLRK